MAIVGPKVSINLHLKPLNGFIIWRTIKTKSIESDNRKGSNHRWMRLFETSSTVVHRSRIFASPLQLDWTSSLSRQKLITGKPIRGTTIPRPTLENSSQGESKSALTIFVKLIIDLFFQNSFPTIAQRKIVKLQLDLPRWIIVCRALRSFWGASIRPAINFLVS